MKVCGKIVDIYSRNIYSGIIHFNNGIIERIDRNENFQSISLEGLFPAAEGAGYAGGIISAAVDGLKIAESIMKNWKPAK